MKNYYEILEIEENAGQDEIKKQYRKLSKEYHPDVNPSGTDKFKEIAEAYEYLGDPQKRQQYDTQRKNPMGGSSFEDIFSQMFGGQNPFQQRRPTAAPKIIKLKVSPIESYLGSEKTITYIKNNHCQTCNGSGGDQKQCNGCNGVGYKVKQFGTGYMVQQVRTTCDSCGGKGYTLVHRCYGCDGKGIKTTTQEVNIKLPIGIDNGQYMKLEGYGDFINGVYGDLVVQVEVEPKDGFEKIDNDLIYNFYLSLDDLNLETYKIPHPDGDLNTKAPKIFDTSKPLRLRGKGYNSTGDMYVKLHVKFERV